jgi:hypothetical protein
MKKSILLLSLFQIFFIQAQVTTSKFQKGTFEPGTYISEIKGQNIKLVLNPDKTYDMSFFFGDYITKNDTLQFLNLAKKAQAFLIKPNPNAAYSSTLKLKLNYDLSYYYSSTIYIGTQSDENRKVSYKLLKDYFDPSNEDLTQQTIDVEKSKYLYIVEAKYDKTTISKFRIPEDINEAEVEYNPYTESETKLFGYIDSSNQFVISDGKNPVLFNFEKEDKSKEKVKTEFEPVDVKTDNNWLKENGFIDVGTDQSVEAAYAPPYVFKHKITTSLSNAQSEIKKTSNKFLIVSYDPKNKNAKTEFNNFIKTSEESISSYMYSVYNATYDNFNFYLASDCDKSLLRKNNISSDKEIVVLNNSGEIVYHTKGSLEEKKDLFSIYNSIHKELLIANEKLELDKIMSNKSASVKELKAAFRKTISSETAYATIAPPIVAVEEVKFTPPVPVKDDNVAPREVIEEKGVVEMAADTSDTVVEAAYDDSYYDIIKDKENLYAFKSNKEAVMAKWKKVLDNFKNSTTYDKEFVQIIKAELSNIGFTNKLFPKANYNSTDLDFELLDYVFTNYKILSDPPAEKVVEAVKEDAVAAYEPYYYEQDIKTAVNSYFSYSNFPENPQIDKVLKYYKKYLEISGFDATAVQNYLSALKQNIEIGNNKKEYLETYENYFNSIVKENTSIIENLDTAFEQKDQYSYADWTTYKNSFANLANDVSWYLVEKSNDAVYLKKAIKWSETSLILEKNNHYYLDTLAQIYYKNGMKQKAIETEQKAIDANQDSENIEEYNLVLERMKNGTY